MPGIVIRRTQLTDDKIPDRELTGVKLVKNTIGTTEIKARGVGSSELGSAVIKRTMYGSPVDYTKAYFITQRGSGTPPYTAGYVSFSVAYGTPPQVGLTKAGETATAPNFFEITSVAAGSFAWRGSPAQRYRWSAFGFR